MSTPYIFNVCIIDKRLISTYNYDKNHCDIGNICMKEKLLYNQIPPSRCKEGCFECCKDLIQLTKCEEIAINGYSFDGQCSHLIDGNCSVYPNRPFVCRMFGVSALLECADCKPERILSEEETKNLFQQYLQLREQELSDNWAQVEQK